MGCEVDFFFLANLSRINDIYLKGVRHLKAITRGHLPLLVLPSLIEMNLERDLQLMEMNQDNETNRNKS